MVIRILVITLFSVFNMFLLFHLQMQKILSGHLLDSSSLLQSKSVRTPSATNIASVSAFSSLSPSILMLCSASATIPSSLTHAAKEAFYQANKIGTDSRGTHGIVPWICKHDAQTQIILNLSAPDIAWRCSAFGKEVVL